MREVDSVAGAGAALLPPSFVVRSLSGSVDFLSTSGRLPLNVRATASQRSHVLVSTHHLGSNAGTLTESSTHLGHSSSRLEFQSTAASPTIGILERPECVRRAEAQGVLTASNLNANGAYRPLVVPPRPNLAVLARSSAPLSTGHCRPRVPPSRCCVATALYADPVPA